MPTSKPNLDKFESQALATHGRKHKTYPYSYRINKTVNNTNFDQSGATGFRYLTYTFTTKEVLPVISIAANFIITPNTLIGTMGYALSYKSSLSLADNASPTVPDDEGGDIYKLLSNGGAINDFQVFYPLNWYMDRNSPLYIHIFVDTTTATAGTGTMVGQVILGTLPTGV